MKCLFNWIFQLLMAIYLLFVKILVFLIRIFQHKILILVLVDLNLCVLFSEIGCPYCIVGIILVSCCWFFCLQENDWLFYMISHSILLLISSTTSRSISIVIYGFLFDFVNEIKLPTNMIGSISLSGDFYPLASPL